MLAADPQRRAAGHQNIQVRRGRQQLGDCRGCADHLFEIIQQQTPTLIICDLHSQRINPIELVKHLKAKEETKNIPLLGFFSHVQTELQRDAQAAGFDRVIPRSVFASSLINILSGTE